MPKLRDFWNLLKCKVVKKEMLLSLTVVSNCRNLDLITMQDQLNNLQKV